LPPNYCSVSRKLLKALVLLFHHNDVNTVTVELGNVGLGVISVVRWTSTEKKDTTDCSQHV